MKMLRKIIPIIILSLSLSMNASAQQLPPGDQPGAQAERFREETERERKRVEKKKTPPPEIQIEKKEGVSAPVGPQFILKEIDMIGSTAFTPEELKETYKDYIGKSVSFKDLETITAAIEAKYKKKGYMTAAAYVPKQDIANGIVKISVAEGRMGKLKVEGNKYFSTDYIRRYFHLKKNELLDFKVLQRDILRLNQNSDLEVKTLVSPGEEDQTSDITLMVKDKLPWHVGSGVDNQGTRLTGLYRTSIYGRSSNVTGNGDSAFVNTLLSSSSFGQAASYNLPVDTYGTKLGFDFMYFRMKLKKEFSSFNIVGETQIYTPRMSWDIALTELFTANINMGLDIKSIKKFMGSSTTSDDQLRLPYVGYDITNIDSLGGGGQNSFSPKFTFGTASFLNASARNSAKAGRPSTDGNFVKYTHSFSRYQKMPFESYMQIRSQLQVASQDLPYAEQFQLGGENSIRGYPEGDYLADSGANLGMDWVFPMYLIPKDWKLKNSNTPLRNQIEPCIFMDLGGGKLMKTLPGERKEKFLMGLGGGFRVRLYNTFLKFEWAKDVGDAPISGSGPSTFYLTFQAEL